MSKTWGKEDELKALKSELAALDRKITAELAPTHEVPDDRMGVNHDEKDGEEIKRNEQPQQSDLVEKPAQSPGSKESMVAEPQQPYKISIQAFLFFSSFIKSKRQDSQRQHMIAVGCLAYIMVFIELMMYFREHLADMENQFID